MTTNVEKINNNTIKFMSEGVAIKQEQVDYGVKKKKKINKNL